MIKISIDGVKRLSSAVKKGEKLKTNLPIEFSRILNLFGNRVVKTAKTKYLSGPRPEKLGVGTGFLRSNIRNSPAVIIGNKVAMTVGTQVKYAPIHEFGGTTQPKVTKKARRFFWYKFSETGDAKWRAMALTKKMNFVIRIKKRPFLMPSFQDNIPSLKQDLSLSVQSSIAGLFNV